MTPSRLKTLAAVGIHECRVGEDEYKVVAGLKQLVVLTARGGSNAESRPTPSMVEAAERLNSLRVVHMGWPRPPSTNCEKPCRTARSRVK